MKHTRRTEPISGVPIADRLCESRNEVPWHNKSTRIRLQNPWNKIRFNNITFNFLVISPPHFSSITYSPEWKSPASAIFVGDRFGDLWGQKLWRKDCRRSCLDAYEICTSPLQFSITRFLIVWTDAVGGKSAPRDENVRVVDSRRFGDGTESVQVRWVQGTESVNVRSSITTLCLCYNWWENTAFMWNVFRQVFRSHKCKCKGIFFFLLILYEM
jgi:hypothetical protein